MTLPHPDPDQVKRDLARRYVVERGWKLLLLAPDTKTPINSWRSGKKEGFDPAALPKSRGARRDYLRTFAASTDPALVRAWLDEWPDAGLAVDCAQSSLIAIDLDQKPDEGKDGNEALSRIFLQHFPGGRRDEPPSVEYADSKNPFGKYLHSRTPSGGQHLLYNAIDPLFDEPRPAPFQAINLGHDVLGVKGLDIKWNGYVGIPSGDGRRDWLNEVEPGPIPPWLYAAIDRLRGARAETTTESSEPGLWSDDDAREYLAQLDVEAFRHDEAWEEVMMGLHHATSGQALGPFIDWCLGDKHYRRDAKTIITRWNSLGKKPDGPARGEGTLLNVLGRDRYLRPGGNTQWKPKHRRAESDFDALPEEGEAPKPPRRGAFKTYVLADVQMRDVEFLFDPYVPYSALTLLDGDPNVGKSTLMYDLAARVTTGVPMPFCKEGRPPRRVLVVNSEDAADDTVRPRLEAAGADTTKVIVMDGVWNASQIEGLAATVEQIEDLGMIIIDVIMSAMGGVDAHRDNEVRSRLLPLADLARRRRLVVMAGRHLHKGEKSKAIYGGGASIAFSGIARSVLLTGPNPDAPNENLLAPVKMNLVPRGTPSLCFRTVSKRIPGLQRTQPLIAWLGTSPLSADDLVRYVPGGRNIGTLRARVGRFLAGYFAERSEAKATDVRAAAVAHGIEADPKTWERARDDYGIVSTGGGPNTIWRLIEAAPPLDPNDSLAS